MQKYTVKPIALQDGIITDAFWGRYICKVSGTILPYQWELMNDHIENCEKSGCIQNFKIAAGESNGDFIGMPFQDSDLAKWMEAAAFSLAVQFDEKLMEQMDEMIKLLGHVQQEDGYFDTYFILKEPNKKWLNLLEGHELYVSGHFIEAAVAYYKTTGKNEFLNIVCKNADLICRVFGENEGQLKAYPGHQEIELALLKLYEVTGEEKYLKQAKFFLMERGREPYILKELHEEYGKYIFPEFASFDREYCQTHLPVMKQTSAEGHAVRAVYMYTAMAHLARLEQNDELLNVCEKLYENIVNRRMYITGGIGSAGTGERFTCDYDLPNDMAYAESCASIGLAMFCQQMFEATENGKYIDTMERALYNTVLSGISLDGKKFFYVNPLEVWPEVIKKNPDHAHVKATRQSWFSCACCPPNIARTLASLQSYACYIKETTAYIGLYLSGIWNLHFGKGALAIRIDTAYPFDGEVRMTIVETQGDTNASIAFRIPKWSKKTQIFEDGKQIESPEENGFITCTKKWEINMSVVLKFDMHPRFMFANPKVRADAGKTALMKGPLVYCFEEEDNGENLSALSVDICSKIQELYDKELFGGTNILQISGWREEQSEWGEELYRPFVTKKKRVILKAIPYCFWNNRKPGEMRVWMEAEKER